MIYSLKYTDSVPSGSAGYARMWFIRIRPAYKDDKGLLEHEKVHVRQFWRTFGFHGLLYLFSKRYRLNAEVEAFMVQLEYAADREEARRSFALRLATHYNLDITVSEALIALGG